MPGAKNHPMPNAQKQSGHAVLSRGRTVKVNGVNVGFWERENWQEVMYLNNFSFSKGKRSSSVGCSEIHSEPGYPSFSL
jgi:hypothetical protein